MSIIMKYIFLLSILSCVSLAAKAIDVSGNVAAELQFFPDTAQFAEQMDENLTLSFQPKFRHSWSKGDDELTVELFLRADSRDDNRQHADIREFKWLHVSGSDEWRVGINTVFWGVTESQHLVDVINQIDRLEGIDAEDKLGQPMVQYTTLQDWGNLHIFVMPGFREARFRSETGRLRFPFVVDSSQALYQSSDEERHIDYALRYDHYIGDTEFGLSIFDGTNREAEFRLLNNVLVPFYSQMTQFGLDLQSIIGDWTWKVEAIHRSLDSGSFNAATAGFEYTFYGVLDSSVDMGTLLEYSWDSRDVNAPIFDSDIFGGFRFAFNDVQSSEVLAGLVVDTDKGSQSFRVEASKRIGESWKLIGELQVFSHVDVSDPLKAFEQDDYILLELAKYF